MSIVYGIQGQILEVTVVACNKLKDTEWISRQDPYVCLEYGSSKYRTRTCTDGGKNPTFQEKFVFTLIEGLREINVVVWNSNTVNSDDFIGSGKVQLQKVLGQGYDDTAWPLQTKRGRHAGEVRLIMHYANANKPATSHAQSGSPYVTPTPGSYPYSAAPPHVASHPPPSAYPAPSPYSTVPPPSAAYHSPSPYPTAPPPSAAYHPASPYPPQSAAYPSPYSSPSAYPPPPYPPQGYSYPPGPYPGAYPPR
ncbi:hypothetical protein K7X08_038048 [Anisodus acutangulus]|uniref:C2 domain-containing protein n=1 Tax=Anisodus acutangulus TaxID=402998 RepID=A0A9Q1RSL7_9SOLA|nr:hypothetical protein K7X08_038048 [Anisodus acutangulus]